MAWKSTLTSSQGRLGGLTSLTALMALAASALMPYPEALAKPIFTNVAVENGLGDYAGALRLLKDSENGNHHYLLPSSFTSSIAVSPFFSSSLLGELNRTPGPTPGSATFSFLLLPEIDVFGAASVASTLLEVQERNPDFLVVPLECLDGDLELGGIPRSLYEDVSIRSITLDLPDLSDFELLVPPGYAYSVSFTSSQPDILQSALMRLGVKGVAKMTCDGYVDEPATKGLSTPVRQGIPVNATFNRIIAGE